MTARSAPAQTASLPAPTTTLDGLTALRGIAAWWVVLYHFREFLPGYTPRAITGLADGGYLAVDFFFELSGFVIALNYGHRLEHFDWRIARRFLALRLARIYPLHGFMLLLFLLNPLAVAVFSHNGTPDGRYDPAYFMLSVLLLQCWGFTGSLAWNIPAWSISAELGAYLAFPLIAVWLPRFGKTPARAVVLIGTIMAVLACLAFRRGGLNADIPHFGLVRCLLEFCAGCALFRVSAWSAGVGARGNGLLAAASLLLLTASLAGFLPDYLAAPPAMLMLLFAVQSRPSWAIWLLERKALVWAGEISYSTYMIHYFAKDWIKFLVVGPRTPPALALGAYVGLVLGGSALLYRLVEVPSRSALRGRIGRL